MDELNSERIITPMPKSLVTAVDDYRFSNRMPSRAEAIRRLIEMGLEAAASKSTQQQGK
jgi:metal-responsive CopG/Arc/MetJ family transcriptional regulator